MILDVPVDPNMLNQFQSTMPQVKEQMKAAKGAAGATAAAPFAGALCKSLRRGCMCCRIEVPDELELKIMGALS